MMEGGAPTEGGAERAAWPRGEAADRAASHSGCRGKQDSITGLKRPLTTATEAQSPASAGCRSGRSRSISATVCASQGEGSVTNYIDRGEGHSEGCSRLGGRSLLVALCPGGEQLRPHRGCRKHRGVRRLD
jgi:hypothetical protein